MVMKISLNVSHRLSYHSTLVVVYSLNLFEYEEPFMLYVPPFARNIADSWIFKPPIAVTGLTNNKESTTLNFSKVTTRNNIRWLVINTPLEATRTLINKLYGPLSLESG